MTVLRAGKSGPDVTVSEVVRMLLGHGVRSLPVLDAEGQVQGMFSRGDALRLMLRPDETISAAAQVRLDDYFGPRRWFALARDGAVTVTGTTVGESERRIAVALVRTVPGVREVTLATRSSCG
ncbi:CBS domain-containing protein [Gordonia amicalis]|uniref:CBS domain-containing protein n=1 Tax=Gordonia amicalis TaxID=89053 RepID=UPI0002A64EBB|nr:CBS domain-containing protein [Gordonia amicalis]GAC53967.1 hypothetical protein GOAMI_26_00150 [Gordonia amicalis NBRC 100051 = JCM 11271]